MHTNLTPLLEDYHRAISPAEDALIRGLVVKEFRSHVNWDSKMSPEEDAAMQKLIWWLRDVQRRRLHRMHRSGVHVAAIYTIAEILIKGE